MKNQQVRTNRTGAGHYHISIIEGVEEVGNFDTTDMQLIDDIQEMNDDGFEKELVMHDTFKEVIETCLNRMKTTDKLEESDTCNNHKF